MTREKCGECYLHPGEICDICGAMEGQQMNRSADEQMLEEIRRHVALLAAAILATRAPSAPSVHDVMRDAGMLARWLKKGD